jgi:hypothetical protein
MVAEDERRCGEAWTARVLRTGVGWALIGCHGGVREKITAPGSMATAAVVWGWAEKTPRGQMRAVVTVADKAAVQKL